jgi:hypothetical protein
MQMRVIPIAKNVGVEAPGSIITSSGLLPGGLRRPLNADRAAYAAPLKTDPATARYLASGFSRAFTMPRRGRNRSAQGRARRRSRVRRPGLTVPPKFFALKGRDKLRDVVRIKRHRSQRRAPLSFHPFSSFLTEFCFISISWLCRPFRAGGYWLWICLF